MRRVMALTIALSLSPALALADNVDTKEKGKPVTTEKTEKTTVKTEGAAAADNTKRNRQEEIVAGDQSNKTSDLDITKHIRRRIVKDDSLSVYAHNVKIITNDGLVTLKGPVRSDEERKRVENVAVETVGASKVKNELEIAR